VPEERNFFKGPVMNWFMRRVRCIPIRRGEGVYQPAVERAIEILRHGGCVHVAPEGTRTRSGKLLPGKAGVGRVLYETGATVVPCFHRGMGDILPIGARFPRVGQRAEIIVGSSFRVDQFLSLPNTRETWQSIADHVMERIAALE
jgi:1-acyl-sn-glycerol-3-phosphate acyltransferase